MELKFIFLMFAFSLWHINHMGGVGYQRALTNLDFPRTKYQLATLWPLFPSSVFVFCLYSFACMLRYSVVSDSLRPCGLQPARLLSPWDSPGKNTGVDCRALLQGIFLTQGSNPCLSCLLHWQAGSLPLVPPGKLFYSFILWLLEPNKKAPLFCDVSIAGHYQSVFSQT